MIISLSSVCSFAGVALPGNVMAEMPSKFAFSKFILENGHIVEVRASTASRLADAYKALCAKAERRAKYLALSAKEQKKIRRARRDRRARQLSKQRKAAAKASLIRENRMALRKRAERVQILHSLEKEPSRAQQKKAIAFFKKVESSLPPRPTEAQCLLAKYRAWRNKQAASAAKAAAAALEVPKPPPTLDTSRAAFPYGKVEGVPPPTSPCSATFGSMPIPKDGEIFSLPPTKGWRTLPMRQRVEKMAKAIGSYTFQLVGGYKVLAILKQFRITKTLIESVTGLLDQFLSDIDQSNSFWIDYITPVQSTGALKAVYNDFPTVDCSGNGIMYPKVIQPSDPEGCDCDVCLSNDWTSYITPITHCSGRIMGVFNNFPVIENEEINNYKIDCFFVLSIDGEDIHVTSEFLEEEICDKYGALRPCTCEECCINTPCPIFGQFKGVCKCAYCSISWLNYASPVHSTGSLKAVYNDFPIFTPNIVKGFSGRFQKPWSVHTIPDKEGCDCDDCLSSSWEEYVSPVHRTGSLKAVFNDFPEFQPSFVTKFGSRFYTKWVPNVLIDEEGCTCNECNSSLWIEYITPVQRTGRLHSNYIGVPLVVEGIYTSSCVRRISADAEGCLCTICSAPKIVETVEQKPQQGCTADCLYRECRMCDNAKIYCDINARIQAEGGEIFQTALKWYDLRHLATEELKYHGKHAAWRARHWHSNSELFKQLKCPEASFIQVYNLCLYEESWIPTGGLTDFFPGYLSSMGVKGMPDLSTWCRQKRSTKYTFEPYVKNLNGSFCKRLLVSQRKIKSNVVVGKSIVRTHEQIVADAAKVAEVAKGPQRPKPIVRTHEQIVADAAKATEVAKGLQRPKPIVRTHEQIVADAAKVAEVAKDPQRSKPIVRTHEQIVADAAKAAEVTRDLPRSDVSISRQTIMVKRDVEPITQKVITMDQALKMIRTEPTKWSFSKLDQAGYIVKGEETFKQIDRFLPFSHTYSSMPIPNGASELHEEAQLASDMIERNYTLLTPQALIETALSKEVRSFKIGEGKILGKTRLKPEDVFYIESFMERLQRGLGNGIKPESKITFNQTTNFEVVRHPGNKEHGKLSQQIFSRLPMMQKNQARKLLEKGIVSSERTAFDLGLISHMPQGKPYIALVTVMDGRFDDTGEAILCSSYVNLGQKQARLMVAPLVNFPLTKEDITDFVDNLYICTIIYNIGSLRSGCPVFSYGVIEAAEHWERANWDASRFVGDWDKILSGPTKRGGRVLAGFNLEGIASAPLDEPIPDLNQKLEIVAKPPSLSICGQLTVNGQTERAPVLQRAYSVAGPSRLAGRSTIFSQRFVPPIVSNWETTRGRDDFEISETYSSMSTEISTSSSVGKIFSYQEFAVPKGTVAGKVLCDHHLMEKAEEFSAEVWHQLLTMQNFTGKFSFEVDLNISPLMGISIGVCFDFYNSLNLEDLGDLPIKAAALLPNFVFSSGDPIKGSFDIREQLGHSLSVHGNSFGSGRIIVYTTTNNSILAAEDFTGLITTFLSDINPAEFLLQPTISMPEFTTDERHHQIALGRYFRKRQSDTSAIIKFDLDFARIESVLTGKSALCHTAAIQSILAYQTGELEMEFFKLGSAFIQGGFIVSSWWGNQDHSLSEILRVHHVRLNGGIGKISIPISTPFGNIPMMEKRAQILLYFHNKPSAPSTYTGAYEGFVKFLRFKPKIFIPRTISFEERYAWCSISDLTSELNQFYLPARLCEIKLTGALVVMWNNHLHKLVATSGIFRGSITYHLSISYKKRLTELNGRIRIQSAYGRLNALDTWQRKSTRIFSCYDTHTITQQLLVGDFSGATTSSPREVLENFMVVGIDTPDMIDTIDVDVEVHHLDFYGNKIVII
uniref:Putative polyprotein 2 n=1 Tax=Green Sichuan pepper nepovirus TaxID=2802553 RepID=A0A8F3IZL1_9SECO|nr:putative polyprotein 2 [Green Sichuan pepper nepovirus]